MQAENFSRFGLDRRLITALSELGIAQPTEIQERLIPAILNGRDCIGQSQTGTGKTFAFLLPLVNQIDTTRPELQAIVTAPTRELATQLFQELKKLLVHFEGTLDAQLFVGGTDRKRQADKLATKQPHIVVGTPGRIGDLIKNQWLVAYTATTFVVDEADQMLDMGFLEEVDQIAARLAPDLQMLVFSATVPENLQPFLRKYMNDPRHVHVSPHQTAATRVTHQLVPIRHQEKLTVLKQVIQGLSPYLALIFTNTKEEADEVTDALVKEGVNVDCLHGGLSPRERKQVMKRVAAVDIQYLVATDLAARGMDIKGVSHVINFSFPTDLDYYVHRIGRTARAGADGLALTLYDQKDEAAFAKLVKRGIVFQFVEYKKDEWIVLDKPPVGAGRVAKRTTKSESHAKKDAPKKPVTRTGGKAKAKPKKVKPAYKRKARVTAEKKKPRSARKG
ncbi:DEAD/DEAH box helicase [Bacillus sp. FSL W7-1360]